MKTNNNSLLQYYQLFFLVFILSTLGCKNNTFEQGKELYTNNCSQCHGEYGKGLNQLIPPIANSDYYKNNQDKLSCIIRDGLDGSILVNGIIFNEKMAGNPKLNDVEICNIINYINTSFYSNFEITPLQNITISLKNCETNN